MAKPKVLFVMLEYPKWEDASHWGYVLNMAFEYGFKANDVEYYILPVTHHYGERTPCWADYAKTLLAGQKFDQVWFEVSHSRIEDDIMEFLCELAPRRLGISVESLELLPEEWANNPEACVRREAILQKRLANLTHLITTDELDAKRLDGKSGLQVRPFPPGFVIPRQFIHDDPPRAPLNVGLFYGALYGERKEWLASPKLSNILRYCPLSPELNTPLPSAFDNLHVETHKAMANNEVDQSVLDTYLHCSRQIRFECFRMWLDGLRLGAAVVNLPQWGRAYASRVVEGMAAGRPVITRQLVDRPISVAAFEDGKEILLYRTQDELAAHLEKVLGDYEYAKTIASNARKKIIANHTTEGYVGELIKWIN